MTEHSPSKIMKSAEPDNYPEDRTEPRPTQRYITHGDYHHGPLALQDQNRTKSHLNRVILDHLATLIHQGKPG
jgi:hypothetical protein